MKWIQIPKKVVVLLHNNALRKSMNIYIYIHTERKKEKGLIYSHPQTDLFRSIRTHQCGYTLASRSWDRNLVDSDANPKPLNLQPRDAISCEVNLKQLWITITIVYIHPFNGYRDLNSYMKRLAINAKCKITSSPENSTLRGVEEYIYIYIYETGPTLMLFDLPQIDNPTLN